MAPLDGFTTRATLEALLMVFFAIDLQSTAPCEWLLASLTTRLTSRAHISTTNLEVTPINGLLATTAHKALLMVSLLPNAHTNTFNWTVTSSARLGWILDLVTTLTQEVFHSTICTLVNEETARYVLVAHTATETFAVVGLSICADAFVKDLLTASTTAWCTGRVASIAKESGVLWRAPVLAIDGTSTTRTSEAFSMVSGLLNGNRLAIHLAPTSCAHGQAVLVARLALKAAVLVEEVRTDNWLAACVASEAFLVVALAICCDG